MNEIKVKACDSNDRDSVEKRLQTIMDQTKQDEARRQRIIESRQEERRIASSRTVKH